MRGRDSRRTPVSLRHIRRGAQLAALVELLAGDPQASLDAAAVQAALEWEPADGQRARETVAVAVAAVVAVFAVTVGLQSSPREPRLLKAIASVSSRVSREVTPFAGPSQGHTREPVTPGTMLTQCRMRC